jgi:hypothetical protein
MLRFPIKKNAKNEEPHPSHQFQKQTNYIKSYSSVNSNAITEFFQKVGT